MTGLSHLMSGADAATGTFVLLVFAAGAAMAVLTGLAVFTVLRAGQSGLVGTLWGGGLVLAGAALAFLLFDRTPPSDPAADRRAIEARAGELTAQAIAPGSSLACLDASNVAVEAACEKALFATPEVVASAVAYTDARLSLLASAEALVERDASYRPVLDRLRHSIEQDRFGFVAHVLAARGCNGPDCADLALLHDTRRILANIKAHAFEGHVGAHSLAWQPAGADSIAGAPQAANPPPTTAGVASTVSSAPLASAGQPAGHYDFPSASSIPPVSIMTPEPTTPPAAEKPPPKRPSARKPVAREAPPSPPTQIVPPAQTAGSR
jgi:hypothetical protein